MRSVVMIGVGEATEAAEAIDLMEIAATRALADSGASAARPLPLDAIVVPRGSWDYEDPGRELARRLGTTATKSILGDLGVSQQGLIQEALRLLSTGEAAMVLVVGGESRRSSAANGYRSLPGKPDRTLERPVDFVDDLEIETGIAFPAVRSYALLQRALDHRDGLSDEQGLSRASALWASMSQIAAASGRPAFEAPRDREFLSTPSSENRPMAAPYLKWHCSQWNVDAAGALLFATTDAARQAGLEPSAALWPHVALESSHALPVVRRADLARWPAMEILGHHAATHVGRPLADVDVIDLYSCFPAAVLLQAAELGIPLEPAPSVTGGMSFAGGPFNNYVVNAHVAMARRLRANPGTLGLSTTVSGLLTKPGLGIWSTLMPSKGLLLADLGAKAAAATGQVACTLADAETNVRIESSTAFHDGERTRSVVLGRDVDGNRRLLTLDDEESFHRFSARSCIGERLR